MTYTGLSKVNYQLESSRLAGGGEGDVFRVISRASKKIAKIYHTGKLSHELENKLLYMVDNPPDPSVLNQVAWPQDVLYDTNNKFCGFVMPELSISAQLKDIYQYPPTAGLSARQKVVIAENICAVISAVHSAGYVFGDFNPCNIGVDKNTGKVAFLDTDSYHVFDRARNRHYRCKVCADGYAAPELLEACANHAASYPNDSKQLYEKTPLPTFTKKTDNFALAIHIFKLLMNGFTPFGGIIETITPSQASPSRGNVAIRRNEYSFRPGYKPMSPAVSPLDIFPQEIEDLFTRAFLVVGPINPSQRPTSIEWHQALTRYEANLIDCPSNGLHQYDGKNKTCPFCEADWRYKQSISRQKTQSPTTPLPIPVSLLQQRTYSPPQSGASSQTSSGTYGGNIAQSGNPLFRFVGIFLIIIISIVIISNLIKNISIVIPPSNEHRSDDTRNHVPTPPVSTVPSGYLNIPPINDNRITIGDAVIEIKQGNFSERGQHFQYSFTAPRDGRYRFEMAELRANARVYLTAWNNKDERIDSGNARNGEGLTLNLIGGQTYRVYINQDDGLSPYDLIIGHQKETVDISSLTKLSDSIQYTNQMNSYSFTAHRDGRYRFEMAELRANARVLLTAWNRLDERIGYEYARNGGGLTLDLIGGQTYRIYINQDDGLSPYNLIIRQ